MVKSVCKTTRGSALRTAHGPIGAVLSLCVTLSLQDKWSAAPRRYIFTPVFLPTETFANLTVIYTERDKGQRFDQDKSFEGFSQRRTSTQLFSGVRSPLSYSAATADGGKNKSRRERH